jgi:hypothetical protein
MLATSLVSEIKSLHSDLKQGVCKDIIAHIDFIHQLLLRASYPARPYTAKAVEKLLSLDEEAKSEILRTLTSWKAILVAAEGSLENANEVVFAEKALDFFRFTAKDFKWNQVAKNEIIEIYNTEGVQLYRSLNFFSICSYSLLDLCVNKWFELWERPTATIEAMNTQVFKVITGQKTDYSVAVAPHLVRETYNDGATEPFIPRATIVTFQKIFPLYALGGSDVVGFVITSTGKPVASGEEANGLGFI